MQRSKRSTQWLLISILVAGGVVGARACRSSTRAPDEQLAAHIRGACAIAAQHVDAPRAGVKKLMRYMGDHSPAMHHEWAATLVLIERIDDDRAHDDRARLAGRRLHKELKACEQPLNEFFAAVEADPEASATLQHALERLSRTLDIIGNGGARALPAQVEALIGAALLR